MGYLGRKYGLKVLDITLPGTCPECGIARQLPHLNEIHSDGACG